MKIKVWAETDRSGSKSTDVIEVDDDLSEDEIGNGVIDYLLDRIINWGWTKMEGDNDDE